MRRGERKTVERIARLLEEWGELEAAGLVRREYVPDGAENVAEFFDESGDTAFAERWRRRHSDAGVYLLRTADVRDRTRELLERTEAIRTAVDDRGRWEDSDEWRIGTPGTVRLERVDAGYRATAEYHGRFSADFPTFPEAYEAMRVLAAIQQDLFYAVGWSSWAGRGRMEPSDPPRPESAVEARYRYLARLADEARSGGDDVASKLGEALERTGAWSDELRFDAVVVRRHARASEFIEFSLACRSLALGSAAPTAERAAEFLGIYTRLQRDLAEILEWKWV